jgi:RNA polymerase sigma-70 factor (ECF subfamily)
MTESRRLVERVARESYGRLLAILVSSTRDLSSAEDVLAEAFAEALTRWPHTGAPSNPEAWLVTVARRRQTDGLRRKYTSLAAERHLRLLAEEAAAAAEETSDWPDRRLALMFACAAPGIDTAMHAPLILQTLLGLTADQIGAAYLVPSRVMGQRLVRAKARIKEAGRAFAAPDKQDVPSRLPAILDALYAAFTCSWAGNDGGGLAQEAIWLAELLVRLLPDQPEAKGLLSLMLYVQARSDARRQDGAYVPLQEQEPTTWDERAIATAEAMLNAANESGPSGRYQIEAAIQSAHCARRLTESVDWVSIAALYDLLHALVPTPIVDLNRAVAYRHTQGASAALEMIRSLDAHKSMLSYQPFWAARAQLAAESEAFEEAQHAYTLAIGLSTDPAVRSFLANQRAALPL